MTNLFEATKQIVTEHDANAKLIAAAPAMLEALKILLPRCKQMCELANQAGMYNAMVEEAVKAINQAEGK